MLKKDSSSSSSSSSPLNCHLRIHRSNFKTPNVLHMPHLSCTFAVSALTDSGLSFTRRLSFNSNSLGFLVFPTSSLKKKENAPSCEQTGCFCGQPSLCLCLWRGADNKGPHAGSQQICFLSRPFFVCCCFCCFSFPKLKQQLQQVHEERAHPDAVPKRHGKCLTLLSVLRWCPDFSSGGISGA